MATPLTLDFYSQDAVQVAQQLLGKILVRVWPNGTVQRYRITETEAYLGSDDKACHASKGRTPRTEVMYTHGGHVYVYLIYGMYWLLNVVTGPEGHPQAVLIRGLDSVVGSGRVGRLLEIDKSFYGESLLHSARMWIEGDGQPAPLFDTAPRIGISYAAPEWAGKPWRFTVRGIAKAKVGATKPTPKS